MKNSIIAFLAGALAMLGLVYTKQEPKIINVAGDNIEKQKVTDNTKIKTKRGFLGIRRRTKEERKAAKEARILKRKNKRLT